MRTIMTRFLAARFLALVPIFMIALWTGPGFAQYREEFRKELPLAANGIFSLSNVNGGVIVNAYDGATVMIQAVKEAPSADRMAELKIHIEASGERIQVDSEYPKVNGNGFSIKYEITIPKTVILNKIETVNGKIQITGMTSEVHFATVNGGGKVYGCSGRVEGETVNGGLQVEALPGQPLKEVDLKAVNGGIQLIAPDLNDVQVKAETVNGGITTEYPLEVRRGLGGKSLAGTLGNGSGRIHIETVNGGITISRNAS